MKIAETNLWYFIKPHVPKRFWDDILNVVFWFRSRKFKGNQYQCPVCQFKLQAFAGNSCPRCDAGGRHRALWLYLNRNSDLFTRPNLKLLHFAPEHSLHKRIKAHQNIDYLSGDLFSSRAMQKIDMMDIPYPDNHFDVTISLDVLMHVDDDSRAIQELIRVQKSDGWSIHIVSINRSVKKTIQADDLEGQSLIEVFGHFDYKRNYGMDYVTILKMQGFEVEVIGVDQYTSEEERFKFQIPAKFQIFLCRKKQAIGVG